MTKSNNNNFILFGSTGDLSLRKLFPAWYQLEAANLLVNNFKIISVGRREFTEDEFKQLVQQAISTYIGQDKLNADIVKRLINRINYVKINIQDIDSYKQLLKITGSKTYYLATPPEVFADICENLYQAGMIDQCSRIVIEKPIGHDLASSKVINNKLASYFTESQIYRIDHYLGKETVQNLIALRFANQLFSSQWDNNHIDFVEITVAEKVGIEGRWSYFDNAGQLRDMVQNHLLQLLCLVAMEPPMLLDAKSIHDAKTQVLRALKPITAKNIEDNLIMAQYSDSGKDGKFIPGYLNEEGAKKDSATETFVCIRAHIDNWRWSSVPFYLRTGKSMGKKVTEIIITFKANTHFIFDKDQKKIASNSLIIRLQPEEGIALEMLTKCQGIEGGMRLKRDKLNLDFASHSRTPDSYELLLLNSIKGEQGSFVPRDEVELAWIWCDRILSEYKKSSLSLHKYPAGSFGPSCVKQLIEKSGHKWYEDK